jgi:hypothetical protein
MAATADRYREHLGNCRSLFELKAQDYGSAWRILRTASLTDQISIKAQRLRTLELKGVQKVADRIEDEYTGIVNYALMALIQLRLGASDRADLSVAQALEAYDRAAEGCFELMLAKNHDYGEAWKNLRLASITDLMLQKLLRIKQIEDRAGSTLVSEGLEANFMDLVNYALFALIKLESTPPSQASDS